MQVAVVIKNIYRRTEPLHRTMIAIMCAFLRLQKPARTPTQQRKQD
jgi:hypothetical protein